MESARDKLLYCLFRAHLEEVVKAVALHGGVEARGLWDELREQLQGVYSELASRRTKRIFFSLLGSSRP